jgi:hypothetical protein
VSIDIERLVGGLTPANPADPRTFPAIWNDTADDIEQLDGDLTTLTGRVDNLTTDDVAEGTNLYYTDSRVETVIAASTTDDLDEGATNLYYTDARAEAAADGRIAAATTDDLSEGLTNLYYTDARAEAAADGQIAAATTDDLSEGLTNLYYTDARAEAAADGRIAAATTDDLSEGTTNLYYTDTRVENVISASTTDDLSEGAVNLYYTDGRAAAAAPVQSVNTQTGDVVLGAADVGAYPDTNPDSYVDAAGAAGAAPVQSVNTQTGAVSLAAGDVGALPDDAKLGDLSDVVVTGATDGQLIAYNATDDNWQLASPAGITVGDITALNLTWDDF